MNQPQYPPPGYAPPAYTPAYGAPTPPPRRSGGLVAGLVVASVLALALLASTVTFGVLWAGANGRADDARTELAATRQAAADALEVDALQRGAGGDRDAVAALELGGLADDGPVLPHQIGEQLLRRPHLLQGDERGVRGLHPRTHPLAQSGPDAVDIHSADSKHGLILSE